MVVIDRQAHCIYSGVLLLWLRQCTLSLQENNLTLGEKTNTPHPPPQKKILTTKTTKTWRQLRMKCTTSLPYPQQSAQTRKATIVSEHRGGQPDESTPDRHQQPLSFGATTNDNKHDRWWRTDSRHHPITTTWYLFHETMSGAHSSYHTSVSPTSCCGETK